MVLGRCPSARVEVVPGGENKGKHQHTGWRWFLEERTKGNTNIRQCLRKVTDGQFTAAVKVLSSSGAQHILDALCGEGSASATDLLKAITSVVNLWLAGRCPPILAEFVAYALLTPLLKLDNDI
ncbi:hypothetical protein Tco_0117857 [Tanacetum coccineum]